MSSLAIEVDATEWCGTALIASDGSVWVPVEPRWWDLATRIWWWLAPGERKARVVLVDGHGKKIRARAVRLAKRHVRIRGAVE